MTPGGRDMHHPEGMPDFDRSRPRRRQRSWCNGEGMMKVGDGGSKVADVAVRKRARMAGGIWPRRGRDGRGTRWTGGTSANTLHRYTHCVTVFCVNGIIHIMAVNRNCHQCGTRFLVKVERKIFCSDRCRVRYHREHRLVCFYCGDTADTIDHLFPQMHGNGRGETVQACKECNSTMGAFGAGNILARIEYLHTRYVKKYQLDKNIPDWSDDELAELGPTLRSSIQAKTIQRENALDRVIHIRARWNEIKRLT